MKKTVLILLSILSLNVSAQTWSQLGSLPSSYEARNHPCAFSIGEFGYLATGAGNFYNGDFHRYDPSNDSWTALAAFPGGARSFAYGVENAGKGYVGFGLVATQQTGVTYYKDLWEYDPITDNWTKLADCPGVGRRHPAMVATPGKIYVGCGDGASDNLKDWWEYDIASNTWAQKKDFPSFKRHHPYFFDINGEAYVGFGHNAQSIYKDMYRYNPANDSWTAIANLPAQGRVAGTQFSYNGKGYLLSGQGEDHLNMATGEFWEYDPTSNQWSSLTPHPGSSSRWAPGCFMIGNILYFTSGETGFGQGLTDQKDLWKYDFPIAASVKDIPTIDFDIYPNPTKASITISTEDAVEEVLVSTIYGSVCSVVAERINDKMTKVNVENLSSGIYTIQVKTKKGQATQQLVIE